MHWSKVNRHAICCFLTSMLFAHCGSAAAEQSAIEHVLAPLFSPQIRVPLRATDYLGEMRAARRAKRKSPPVAPSVDLRDVAPAPLPVPMVAQEHEEAFHGPPTPPHLLDEYPSELVLLGSKVAAGTAARLSWTPDVSINGLTLPTPVLVINGAAVGPTLCLTAAIHGDELNGIEIVRQVMFQVEPERLRGRLIGVPIVNLQGFQRGSRYLPDRRDLNRYFPGDANGSLASRIAHSLFTEVITHCDALVDVHTGSMRRSNLPQVRADTALPEVVEFTKGFAKMAVVHSDGAPGMLRHAAAMSGIPAVTLEMGESMRIQKEVIESGVLSLTALMEREGMLNRAFRWGDPSPIYYNSRWIRAEQGGILFADVDLGDRIRKGEVLGRVTDPITNETRKIASPVNGRVIGMAVDQVVMPGFAAFHIGIDPSDTPVIDHDDPGIPEDVASPEDIEPDDEPQSDDG